MKIASEVSPKALRAVPPRTSSVCRRQGPGLVASGLSLIPLPLDARRFQLWTQGRPLAFQPPWRPR